MTPSPILGPVATDGTHNGSPDLDDGFFRKAFDAAPDGIFVVDAEQRSYVYVNAAGAELVGSPVDLMIGANTWEMPRPDDPELLEELWARLEEERHLEGRYRFIGVDGRPRTVDFKARAHFVPGRHIVTTRERTGPRMPLSPREREVLTALATGRTGAEVAQTLVLSPETVRTHIRNAMEKLGASTRTHAIALAIASGEIDP